MHGCYLRAPDDVSEDHRVHLLTAIWVGIGAAVIVFVTVVLFFRGASRSDLGSR